MKTQVEIYDTILRDGTQGEGISFSVAAKLRVAERLDTFGVHYIEGGFPGSNPSDVEFFRLAREISWKHAQLAAFGSTRRKDSAASDDDQVKALLAAETPVVTIFGKSWDFHVTDVLRTSLEENIRMITDTIGYLKSQGRKVIFDAEHAFDGYKNNPEYALRTWAAAVEAGAIRLVLCDTNGGSWSEEISRIVKVAFEQFGDIVGIHAHNDIGMAVANSMAALEAGAMHAQGTINGYGERTGNCNLTTLIPNVVLKLKRPSVPESSLPQLRELSIFVDEVANVRSDPRQPWVGANAFLHKGGGHADAESKCPGAYSHVDPAVVGNESSIVVSELSGRSNIIARALRLGFDPQLINVTQLRAIVQLVKDREHSGAQFEAADGSLALLIHSVLKSRGELPFVLLDYHVSMRKGAVCEATMKVGVGTQTYHTVAEGDGPVNALDRALRQALVNSFPQLASARLDDYSVRILEGNGAGTAAKTRVLIQTTNGQDSWGTVGVHQNIVEASLQALVESMEYALLRK